MRNIRHPTMQRILRGRSTRTKDANIRVRRRNTLFRVKRLRNRVNHRHTLTFSVLDQDRVRPIQLYHNTRPISRSVHNQDGILRNVNVYAIHFTRRLRTLLRMTIILKSTTRDFRLRSILRILRVRRNKPRRGLRRHRAHANNRARRARSRPRTSMLTNATTHYEDYFQDVSRNRETRRRHFQRSLLSNVRRHVRRLSANLNVIPNRDGRRRLHLVMTTRLRVLEGVLYYSQCGTHAVGNDLRNTLTLRRGNHNIRRVRYLVGNI